MRRKFLITLMFCFFIIQGFSQKLPKVEMKCDLGIIILEIDTINAPTSANNFLDLVRKETFKDAVFYRVVRMDNQPNNKVKIEVIQGGLFSDKKIDEIKSIRHETTKETGIKHLDGTISMARNEPGSASTEFFICVNDQPELDFGGKRNPDGQGFAAFGKVTKGMDVVRKIQKQKDENQYLVDKIQIAEIRIK